jgi:hypothetical protein
MTERAAVTEFVFQVCSRCGHPPSDGPCIMGNEEHAETWPKSFASFGVVRDLAADQPAPTPSGLSAEERETLVDLLIRACAAPSTTEGEERYPLLKQAMEEGRVTGENKPDPKNRRVPTEGEERCDGSGWINMGSPARESEDGCPGCPVCSPQESSDKESDAEEASQ